MLDDDCWVCTCPIWVPLRRGYRSQIVAVFASHYVSHSVPVRACPSWGCIAVRLPAALACRRFVNSLVAAGSTLLFPGIFALVEWTALIAFGCIHYASRSMMAVIRSARCLRYSLLGIKSPAPRKSTSSFSKLSDGRSRPYSIGAPQSDSGKGLSSLPYT